MLLSLFFNGGHIFLPNTVYAQGISTPLSVTITNACEFDDGDDPNDFGNCLPFNDGATISFDNVRFSAISTTPVKQFICTLQRDGVTIPLGSDNTCTTSQLTAKTIYKNLQEEGNYQFTVTGVRDVLGPLGTVVDDEVVTSAVFHFTVLDNGKGTSLMKTITNVKTITNACEFDDGDDPNDFGNCLPFNDGATISFDNVRFNAISTTPVKEFICNLQRNGSTINPDNMCTTSQLTAKTIYKNLQEEGNYQFTVTGVRDVLGPLGTVVDDEVVTSAVFHFTVVGPESEIQVLP
jgi:DNA-binding phage protein